VMVCPVDVRVSWETFYGRMDKSGRITIPKLTLSLLQSCAHDQSLVGAVMEVSIEPAQLGSFFWGGCGVCSVGFFGFCFCYEVCRLGCFDDDDSFC
jgi:hypothetical protein